VRRLKAPHAIHPVYMRASRNPKVVELLTDLWGSLRYDSGKLNMKSAGYGAPIEWHQDWALTRTQTRISLRSAS
jgi:phytanoyl-CoA hydroxylase